jgi:hypothetical protein
MNATGASRQCPGPAPAREPSADAPPGAALASSGQGWAGQDWAGQDWAGQDWAGQSWPS